MDKNFELWERFEKTGSPMDYLEYCKARADSIKGRTEAASSIDRQSKV